MGEQRTDSRPPSWSVGRLLALVGTVAVGLGFGYGVRYGLSLDELDALAGFFAFLALAGIIGTLLVVGLLNVLVTVVSSRGNRLWGGIGMWSLILAGCLVVGSLAGSWLYGLGHPEYQEPPARLSAGTLVLSLSSAAHFEARETSSAACTSYRGSYEVASITADDAGRMASDASQDAGQLEVSMGLFDGGDFIVVRFAVPTDNSAVKYQSIWSARLTRTRVAANGMSGAGTFVTDAHRFDYEGAPSSARSDPIGWPPVLSGDISWSCAAFAE